MVHPTGTFDRRAEVLPHNYQIASVVEEYIATQILSRTDVFDRFQAPAGDRLPLRRLAEPLDQD